MSIKNDIEQAKVDNLFRWGRPFMIVIAIANILGLCAVGVKIAYDKFWPSSKKSDNNSLVMQAVSDEKPELASKNENVKLPNPLTRDELSKKLYSKKNTYMITGDEVKAQLLDRVLIVLREKPQTKLGDAARIAKIIDTLPVDNQNNLNLVREEVTIFELKANGLYPQSQSR